MKKYILTLSIIFCFSFIYAQENDNKFSYKILVGAKYTPIDYIGGGIIGFSVTKNKFSFCFRSDVSLSVSRLNTSIYFGINNYRAYKYFDFQYHFHSKLAASLGYGWISHKDEAYLMDNLGYSVISLGIQYNVSDRIILEFKGDIPFVDFHSPVDQNVAFPASVGMIYILK